MRLLSIEFLCSLLDHANSRALGEVVENRLAIGCEDRYHTPLLRLTKCFRWVLRSRSVEVSETDVSGDAVIASRGDQRRNSLGAGIGDDSVAIDVSWHRADGRPIQGWLRAESGERRETSHGSDHERENECADDPPGCPSTGDCPLVHGRCPPIRS